MHFFHFVILTACQPSQEVVYKEVEPEEPSETLALEPLMQERELLHQELETCALAEVVDASRYICLFEDGFWLISEKNDERIYLGEFDSALGASTDTRSVVVLNGELYGLETDLKPVELDIPVPIERIESGEDSFWLWGVGRLFRWRDGILTEVQIDDGRTIHDFAFNGDRLWLSTPWMIEIDYSEEQARVLSVGNVPVRDLQVDTQGHLWWIEDDTLYRNNSLSLLDEGSAVPIVLPDVPIQLSGPEMWIHSDNYTYRYKDGFFSQHNRLSSDWHAVDTHGRLWVLNEGELSRSSVGRPVVVVGLNTEVTVQSTVQLLPSDPDTLNQLRVWLGTEELDVTPDSLEITIDPEGLNPGEHELRFYCQSDLGDTLDSHVLWVGELPDIGWNEVELISEANCLSCHSGATLTDLSNKEKWQHHIDEIIDAISTDGMPLGGPYLDDDQITTIRAWKAGGFQ